MLAIAGAFSQLFEAEHEDSVYWIFSNFVKKLESLLIAKEDMVRTLKMTQNCVYHIHSAATSL